MQHYGLCSLSVMNLIRRCHCSVSLNLHSDLLWLVVMHLPQLGPVPLSKGQVLTVCPSLAKAKHGPSLNRWLRPTWQPSLGRTREAQLGQYHPAVSATGHVCTAAL